ncbi:flavodoxin family protein [Clostridium beijerinckii]|uniref:Multimeric flavodoxin WrbA n=1 Tax=Clostridium beijerinckii TaxID=1520 RepID=A0A1S8PS72_CLOBE|nr:flavodoxin family protein [Clostridium beijerinckii]NRT75612.1 multimeric flavodoxin WrbA [Clostridium beijerinckii]NSB14661.1 multimeric flavodoxin WrbA [Clostridium beijerinckii]OOM31546.1 2-amino-4-deoxychorismate dehydrogenase [Clostridium beijerinckii]OOM49337.1 2-amino-4-deoxychorismate dehydrogenase [Clostridium beijerinckii]
MKIIAINGSPRKNWNTATLLNKSLEGAASNGAETELINLYDLKYSGCISCFACKRKNVEHGKCAIKDDLTPILEKLKTADAVIFGSPIYYMNITAGMTALLERFLFSNSIYSDEIPTVYPKKIPVGFIYTMNATEEQIDQFGVKQSFTLRENMIARTTGNPLESLYSYNTYQFTDYDKYEASKFSEKEKAKHKAEQFPVDCQKAFDMGVTLVTNA